MRREYNEFCYTCDGEGKVRAWEPWIAYRNGEWCTVYNCEEYLGLASEHGKTSRVFKTEKEARDFEEKDCLTTCEQCQGDGYIYTDPWRDEMFDRGVANWKGESFETIKGEYSNE